MIPKLSSASRTKKVATIVIIIHEFEKTKIVGVIGMTG